MCMSHLQVNLAVVGAGTGKVFEKARHAPPVAFSPSKVLAYSCRLPELHMWCLPPGISGQLRLLLSLLWFC